MGGRRRNLLIIALVLGLLAASAIVIATKPTVLGLDLRGGTQLVYQARPTPQTPDGHARRDRPGDQHHPHPNRHARRLRARDLAARQRRDPGRAAERPERPAGDRPDRDDRAALLLRPRGERRPAAGEERAEGSRGPGRPQPRSVYTFPNLYEAVKFASKRKPECFQNKCTTSGPTYYLFDSEVPRS